MSLDQIMSGLPDTGWGSGDQKQNRKINGLMFGLIERGPCRMARARRGTGHP
ncbi:hypothetical protein [Methylobacterium aquaticum]|uniref:hypothetical protein n=1 Tax=Methylobacterium aquaticum TaxID=270351 RepID=UPI0012E20375|nr:hypothetical protein [Methylobacterium aquaticum]